MKKKWLLFILLPVLMAGSLAPTMKKPENSSWIRVNLLGYLPGSKKVAVWCSKEEARIEKFQLLDLVTGQVAFEGDAGPPMGAYGPFRQTYRLDFSSYQLEGRFVLRAGGVSSPEFTIAHDVYKGAADFCLRYMRQQRSGFNPFLKDSCHTHDGYTMYGPMPDSTHIDVSGGWHDATDYLQYVATSATATWLMMAAWRDYPASFGDSHEANGLAGTNGIPDVLDEARWGLDWLIKMNPRDNWMFNQLADDRDHQGMRLPKEDSFYGKGAERPVYFCTGRPQGLGKYKNRSTGLASTAGKYASSYALAASLWAGKDPGFAALLRHKAAAAYQLGVNKPGVCQTAPNVAPYFYEEDNWTDDMELAAAELSALGAADPSNKARASADQALHWARSEKVSPWMGADTARHYQWYPFINLGHYELARQLQGKARQEVVDYYREGLEKVYAKAKTNAFLRGIPFIWCSNNYTTAFAIQCGWYRKLSGDNRFEELEQANIDWLFGCNPWGTSMVYGLPAWGDFPSDPHSSFSHVGKYPIDGGLVDGPVYGSIFQSLIGITLFEPDEYSEFQSQLAVYHDDAGDFSTNEPTMDGTAWLIYLLAGQEAAGLPKK